MKLYHKGTPKGRSLWLMEGALFLMCVTTIWIIISLGNYFTPKPEDYLFYSLEEQTSIKTGKQDFEVTFTLKSELPDSQKIILTKYTQDDTISFTCSKQNIENGIRPSTRSILLTNQEPVASLSLSVSSYQQLPDFDKYLRKIYKDVFADSSYIDASNYCR